MTGYPFQFCKEAGEDVLPLSFKAATSRVVLSQTFKTLTEFLEKNTKIYSIKLIPLDLS